MLADEFFMRGHGRNASGDDRAGVIEHLLHLRGRQIIGERIVTRGPHVLPGQNVEPALLGEELAAVADDPPIAAKELEALLQAVGKLHLAAVAPEWPFAPGLAVMHHQEVTDAL